MYDPIRCKACNYFVVLAFAKKKVENLFYVLLKSCFVNLKDSIGLPPKKLVVSALQNGERGGMRISSLFLLLTRAFVEYFLVNRAIVQTHL